MNKHSYFKHLCLGALLTAGMNWASTVQAEHIMKIDTRRMGASVQPTMYGLFFEDINFAADGGLYAELVKNRSFEFPQSLMGWTVQGNVEVRTDGPFDRCPHYVRLTDPLHYERRTGLVNEGYFGIGIAEGEDYRFSVWAKAPHGNAAIRVQLINPTSQKEQQEFTNDTIRITSAEWHRYELLIHAPCTERHAQLRIYLAGSETADLEHISLFPKATYNNRENGLRRDIVETLCDLHPGVMRFPGGCIVEGTDLQSRYQWKNTLGPVENRPLNRNRWESCFDYRSYPDYFQSCGLGYYEYFLLCEDIGAEPLPVMNVGMACQFQNWDNAYAHAPLDSLQNYIDDCLDLIEFANGPADSRWGRIRAEMGHPEPFHLKMIGVGNEQWGQFYFDRIPAFVKAIRARYPEIKIVGSSGPDSEGEMFDAGWKEMKRLGVDLVDEHFYRPEEWFLNSGLRYDTYDRRGPKVFAGEYACHGKGKKWNHYETSILEAAFMTGMDRNADIVHIAAYAPLLAHVDGWQWRPDLIWFDNLDVVRTTSYYVQQLFSNNRGTHILPLTMDNRVVAGQKGQDSLFASAVADKKQNEVIIKVVNTGSLPQDVTLQFQGLSGVHPVDVTRLEHTGMDDENTIANQHLIEPTTSHLATIGSSKHTTLADSVPAKSLTVYRIKTNRP